MFMKYAAGAKRYGGGRDAPNIGPSDPTGYAERDLKQKARRQAMLNRLQKTQQGNYMSPDVLRGVR